MEPEGLVTSRHTWNGPGFIARPPVLLGNCRASLDIPQHVPLCFFILVTVVIAIYHVLVQFSGAQPSTILQIRTLCLPLYLTHHYNAVDIWECMPFVVIGPISERAWEEIWKEPLKLL